MQRYPKFYPTHSGLDEPFRTYTLSSQSGRTIVISSTEDSDLLITQRWLLVLQCFLTLTSLSEDALVEAQEQLQGISEFYSEQNILNAPALSMRGTSTITAQLIPPIERPAIVLDI